MQPRSSAVRGGPVLLVLAVLVASSVFRSLCQLVGEMPWLLPVLATLVSSPVLIPAARLLITGGHAVRLSRTATVTALGAARGLRQSIASVLEQARAS